MAKLDAKLKACIKRTLIKANGVCGRGDVVAVVWRKRSNGYSGVAVREMQFGMDSVEFSYLPTAGTVRFLQKQRVILP